VYPLRVLSSLSKAEHESLIELALPTVIGLVSSSKRRRVNCKPVLHRPVETALIVGKLEN
jgi:hypothetical protein